MPRQARLDAPGLLQHVMARGIERNEIFKDDEDLSDFLDRLAAILEEAQTQCYAWALIPNHFHLLVRTGSVPLSRLMRRLMTGYAVSFNKRHRRTGHLFQNRYKSIVCEEDPYLLELLRYIHLNPLRARLVGSIDDLDEYPWADHSAILGKVKNPLIPNPLINASCRGSAMVTGRASVNTLAEKTIEDILSFFGDDRKKARTEYRCFVIDGIEQGTRSELQGGGLIRSTGGDMAELVGRSKTEREKGDERILGSGDFVQATLLRSESLSERKYGPKKTMDELLAAVAQRFEMTPQSICSQSRRREHSKARAVFSYLAVEQAGYSAAGVARFLGVQRMSVHEAVARGKKLCAQYAITGEAFE